MQPLNSASKAIAVLLDHYNFSYADIEKALAKKYDESAPEEIHALVTDFLAQLRAEGLLAE